MDGVSCMFEVPLSRPVGSHLPANLRPGLARPPPASQIVARARSAPPPGASAFELLERSLREGEAALAPAQIDALLQLLRDRKRAAEQRERDNNMGLLLHFLHRSRRVGSHRCGSCCWGGGGGEDPLRCTCAQPCERARERHYWRGGGHAFCRLVSFTLGRIAAGSPAQEACQVPGPEAWQALVSTTPKLLLLL